jgi:hypothetical protein
MKETKFYKDELNEHYYKETDNLILHIFVCREARDTKEFTYDGDFMILCPHNLNDRCINNVPELPTDKKLKEITKEEFDTVVKQVIFDLELYKYIK